MLARGRASRGMSLPPIERPSQHLINKQNGNLSLIEEMARQIVDHTANEEERSVLRRYEGGTNKIGLYKKLLMLRSPLLFEQLIGQGLEYVEHDKRRVALGSGYAFHTAIGNQVMRDGTHYANFTVSGGGENVYIGIIRAQASLEAPQREVRSVGN